MGVETRSPWAADLASVWRRCRVAMAGADAVRSLGTDGLPAPSGMVTNGLPNTEYDAYLTRALYFNATQRTHDSLVGLVMQRPAQSEMPPLLEEMASYIDGRGARLEDFARFAVSEVLEVGGGLAVIDHPTRPEGIVTAGQERAAGLRPTVAWYPLESVLDFRMGSVNGREEITFLRLAETYEEPDPDDEWAMKVLPQVRVYDMVESAVRVRLYRKNGSGVWVQEGEERRLLKSNRQPFGYIPGVFFGPIRNAPGKPPLLDLVEVNLAHWRNSADLEHALHFTGLPTPFASGVDPGEIENGLTLGSSAGYAFTNPNAKIQFATYGADGLGALRDAMKDKVEAMAALGARMLMPENARAESGEALAIRRGGENSALAKVADSVSRSLVLVLETMAEWAGIVGDVSYSLNTDFLPRSMTANDIGALVSAWQAGAITSPELFDQFRTRGIIRDDMEWEEHQTELLGDDDLSTTSGAAPLIPTGSAQGA